MWDGPGEGIAPKGPSYNTRRRRRLWEEQQGACIWCGRFVCFEDATIEHMVRRADGGRSVKENLTMACKVCNHGRDKRRKTEAVEAWKRLGTTAHIALNRQCVASARRRDREAHGA